MIALEITITSVTNFVTLVPPTPLRCWTLHGESNQMEIGGVNGLGGNTCGIPPAGTNHQEIPPPSTQSGNTVNAQTRINLMVSKGLQNFLSIRTF